MSPEPAEILIATPESDAKLRDEYFTKGMKDMMAGKEPQIRPDNGLLTEWYMLGYNSIDNEIS